MPKPKPKAAPVDPGWHVLETVEIRLDGLIPHPENQRKYLDAQADAALAESLRTQGQLVPCIVRKHPTKKDRWELIAGCRRKAAAEKAGYAGLRCEITDATDEQCLAFILNENLQRADLHPLDQAAAIKRYVDLGKSVEEAASAFAMTPTQAAKRLQLLRLNNKWCKALRSEKSHLALLSPAHLEEVARLPDETQQRLFGELEHHMPSDVSLKSWRLLIGEHVGSLSGAPWDPADDALVAKAGACNDCPKRAGRDNVLFADFAFTNGSGACLDRTCFDKKMVAWLQQRMAQVKQETGEEPRLLVPENYDDRLQVIKDRDINAPFAGTYDTVKAKAGEPGAYPCIRVDIHKPGELTWRKSKLAQEGKKRKEDKEQAADEKKGPTLKEKKAKLLARRHKRILELATDWLYAFTLRIYDDEKQKITPAEPEAWLAQFTSASSSALGIAAAYGMSFRRDGRDDATKHYALLRDYRAECERIIFRSLASIFISRMQAHDLAAVPKAMNELEEAVRFFRMPLAAWRQQAETEIPIPKSWGDNVSLSDKLIDTLTTSDADAPPPQLPAGAAEAWQQASKEDDATEAALPICPKCGEVHDGPDELCRDCAHDARLRLADEEDDDRPDDVAEASDQNEVDQLDPAAETDPLDELEDRPKAARGIKRRAPRKTKESPHALPV